MRLAIFVILAAAMFYSCQPEPDSKELVDDLVVQTNFDPQADFSTYLTYSIPTDTIGFVSNVPNDDTIVVAKESQFPRPILEAVRNNLNARGYVRVNRADNPDL